MIIALEGNVNTGKTTFADEFVKENDEYVLAKETPFNPELSALERQFSYIDAEVDRKKHIQSENIILDRSIFSIIIYTLYTDELSKKEKTEVLRKIRKLMKNESILIPDQILLFLRPQAEIYNCYLLNNEMKGTQTVIATEEYCNFFNLYFFSKIKNFDIVSYKTENNFTQTIISFKTKHFLKKALNFKKR